MLLDTPDFDDLLLLLLEVDVVAHGQGGRRRQVSKAKVEIGLHDGRIVGDVITL